MKNTILLIVDMQTGLIKKHPYNELTVIHNIKELQDSCRKHNIEVIHVRHDDGYNGLLEKNTSNWQIYKELLPINGEKIFDKEYNSAFKNTGLKEYLDTKKITTIILVGMQSEFCIDATCRIAYEYDYKVIIPSETTTTFFNDFLSGQEASQYYEKKIWNDRFASVLPIEEVLMMIASNLK